MPLRDRGILLVWQIVACWRRGVIAKTWFYGVFQQYRDRRCSGRF